MLFLYIEIDILSINIKFCLDQILRLPVSRPTSCAFGGANLQTLFVTTARFGLDEDALAQEPWAGGVLAIDLPYRGLAEPRFALNTADGRHLRGDAI